MITCRLRLLTVVFLFSAALPGTLQAQQNEILQTLRKKYNIVLPSGDKDPILVNKGGLPMDRHGARNGKSGYVDWQGRMIVPMSYNYAEKFQNGYAVVAVGEQKFLKYGLIDRAGKVIIPLEWDKLTNFKEGVAVAARGEKSMPSYFLIDTLGKTTALNYNFCRNFSNGYAVVGIGTYSVPTDIGPSGANIAHLPPDFNGKYGFISPSGTLAIPVQFDEAKDFGEDGLAAVAVQGKYNLKWGFVDKSGDLAIPCIYYSVENFNHDLAVVSKVVAGGKLAYGYIDRQGNEVIPVTFEMASSFRFPNTWVGMEQNGVMQYKLIDTRGNSLSGWVVELNDTGRFGHAAAAIRHASGRLCFGILDNDGRVILPFEYDEVTIFSEQDPETGHWVEAAMATRGGERFSFDIKKN